MKKSLTVILALFALAAFTGPSTAQERKKATEKSLPPANKVTLSATRNIVSMRGCQVTALVGFASTSGSFQPLSNYTVNFVKDGGTGSAPASGVSDSKGEVNRTVASDTKVHATVQSGQTTLASSIFACGKKDRTE